MTKSAPAKPERVVLDTNVLFSALAFPPESPPAKAFELGRQGGFDIFISRFIIEELVRALGSRKMGWEPERISRAIKQPRLFTREVSPSVKVDAIKGDKTDNRILECALAARAQVLVTGDLGDIRPLNSFKGVEILTPREFLDKYFPEQD